MARSVATIDSPEFINVKPFNPLISECQIKVLYLGKNRNDSFISKEVAEDMANSLPGCPIVGYFREEKDDFTDHGQKVTIDDEGVKFEVMTKPYGFVAPDAKVWFQNFDDEDDFGNVETRTYLMTTGYLWTGQYEEAQKVVEEGRPQSMELDQKTLDGKWTTDSNTGFEFFIINDAIFSKLAILGNDVEPCFEGAAVIGNTTQYTLDTDFSTSLFTMMSELKDALKVTNFTNEGGLNMDENEVKETETTKEVEDQFTEETVEEVEEEKVETETVFENAENDTAKEVETLKAENEDLQQKYSLLEAQVAELAEYKLNVETAKKDALIESFYMLSDEDKKDVIDNKSTYSLEQIEEKLALVCYKNKIDLSNVEEGSVKNDPSLTFSLHEENNTDGTDAIAKMLAEASKKLQ